MWHFLKRGGLFLYLCLLSMTGCFNTIYLLNREPRAKELVLESLVEPKGVFTTNKVLLLPVDGMLESAPRTTGMFSHVSALVRLKEQLGRAEKDPTIRAVILRVNSPGGTVTASDLMYQELAKFKKKTNKKIVVMMMDVAASGGYYISMVGDQIYALPTAITGSIGVVAFFPSLHKLGEKIGVDLRVIKTGAQKDTGSFWRDFTPEDQRILQGIVESMQQRFLSVVREGRPHLTSDTLKTAGDGRVFTAPQAKELGLIDEIGYLDDAFEAAKGLALVEDAALVTYRGPADYKGNYYAEAPIQQVGASAAPPAEQARTEFNLLRVDAGKAFGSQESTVSPFLYLWRP